jgi:hypothetical protein
MDYIKTTIDGLGDAHPDLLYGSDVKAYSGSEILALKFRTARRLHQMSKGPVNTKHFGVDEKDEIAVLASQGLIKEEGNQYSGIYTATDKARKAFYGIAPLHVDGCYAGEMTVGSADEKKRPASKPSELSIEERLGLDAKASSSLEGTMNTGRPSQRSPSKSKMDKRLACLTW